MTSDDEPINEGATHYSTQHFIHTIEQEKPRYDSTIQAIFCSAHPGTGDLRGRLGTRICLWSKPAASPHTIGAAKLIIGDVKQNQEFYEKMFGMKEVSHYSAEGVYDEPIMGFGEGARLALFSPKAEAPIKKSLYPVALIYTQDFDGLTKRIEDARQPILRLPSSQSGAFRIAITRDPSGNAIEILARPGKTEVGGSKLIVDDRQKAEDFYARIFGVKPVAAIHNRRLR